MSAEQQVENIIKSVIEDGELLNVSSGTGWQIIANRLAKKLLACGVHAISIRQSANDDLLHGIHPKAVLHDIEETAQKIKDIVFGDQLTRPNDT